MNNHHRTRSTLEAWRRRAWMAMTLATLIAVSAGPALAGPGAHGPNGEHLDAPSSPRAGTGMPRFSASSETFELVGELERGVLTLYLDRYETNLPVIDAKIELESDSLRATARYLADREVYEVAATEFIQAISRPGEHSLVVTVRAGPENDLLDATLQIVRAGARATPVARPFFDEQGHIWEFTVVSGVVVALAVTGMYGLIRYQRRRRRRAAGVAQ